MPDTIRRLSTQQELDEFHAEMKASAKEERTSATTEWHPEWEARFGITREQFLAIGGITAVNAAFTITHIEEDHAMSEIQITPEMLAQAQELALRLKAQQTEAAVTPSAPALPLAVTLAIGLAKAVSGTEQAAKAAKGAITGFGAQFKTAYREKRPAAVKVVKATDVSPEELAAAVELLKAQQQNAQ